jgi:hypothetical protein
MITLDLSILNQKGTPMFNSDIFANRPTFGISGRIFISTDTLEIYRDTGTSWTQLGGGGGGSIGGTIAAGQVAFGTSANTIGGTNNLYWDNASTFLGINTNTPNNNLVVNTIVSDGGILLKQNNTSIGELIRVGSNNYSKLLLINAGVNNIDINAGGFSYIRQNNFAIGTNTDTGEKFQVVGSSLLNGDVTFSSSTGMFWNATTSRLGIGTNTPAAPLDVRTTSGFDSAIFKSQYTALGYIGNDNTWFWFGTATGGGGTRVKISTTTGISFTVTGIDAGLFTQNRNLILQNGGTFTDSGERLQVTGNARVNGTQLISAGTIGTGSNNVLNVSETFAPSSGGDSSNLILINPIIDQTGTANGTTRGIFINPSLTGITQNWHSVQWQNSIGWGLYGAGSASNYVNGNLQLGSLTPIGSNIKLQVTGIAHILDNSSYTSGTIQSFVVQKNLTINAAISSSSGICNYVSTGDNLIASSQSVPDSTSFANIYAFNKYQFNSPALTLTANQASPGTRSVTQLFTQNVFKGVNSGTITHMSGVQIGGYYNDNTATITPVITNAYQLLINDTGAYGHTFSFTNRWGIYQEGINDRNYLAGNLMLNSTTDTGQILQVNGAIRVNGQSSGTAGGSSGNYLIINVDGTSYKIALLNP